MKTVTYNIRLNPEIKAEAEKTYAEFGLNLSEAITVFLHKSIMECGFPFDVRPSKPNAMLKASLKEADALLTHSGLKGYTTVEAMNAAMDAEDARDGSDV